MNYVISIILTIVLFSADLSAQKEDHQWIFGLSALDDTINEREWVSSVLDFNQLPPIARQKTDITMPMVECQGTLCDKNGALLLYSNGQSIHGADGQSILNGDTINYGLNWLASTVFIPNEEREPTGFRYVQGVGFIPQPGTDTILALYHSIDDFVIADKSGHFTLKMSKIVKDERHDYRIVDKDIELNAGLNVLGKIQACRHGNGRDWWLLQFALDTVYTYLIDTKGIQLDRIQFLPSSLFPTSNGQCKFSPKGAYFALYGRETDQDNQGMQLMVSGFDRCTGELLSPRLKRLPSHNNGISSGVAFSPNERFLYTSSLLELVQYDLQSGSDVFSTAKVVSTYNGVTCGDSANSPLYFGQMQLAPDNKIYISMGRQCFGFHLIHQPDKKGAACEAEQNAFEIPTYYFPTMPNVSNFRLGPLDGSDCDTLGLDNEPVARFWYEQNKNDFQEIQFWDVSYFRPEAWRWDFGDGNRSPERQPIHRYKEKGRYDVCLTVRNENSSHTSCQTLNLGMVATERIQKAIAVTVFPNPFREQLRVTLHDYLPEEGQIAFYNLSGQQVAICQVSR